MARIGFVLLAMALFSCSLSLVGPSAADVVTQRAEYVAEATAIRAEILAERTRVAATVVPMNTEAAAQNSVNRQLYATVVAYNIAAPGRSIGQLGAESSGMVDGPTGETRFTVAGTAAAVSDLDGCPQQLQTRFPVNAARVFVSLVGYDLTPGILLEARWYFGEGLVDTQSWQTTRTAEQLCIWFYIENGSTEFRVGQWWVELRADGRSLGSALGFVME